MLSRAAANLYWRARYIERADNVARILEVAERASIMPNSAGEPQSEWHSVVIASGNEQGYFERYDEISREKVVHYLTVDTTNPGSIRSCIETARANARADPTSVDGGARAPCAPCSHRIFGKRLTKPGWI